MADSFRCCCASKSCQLRLEVDDLVMRVSGDSAVVAMSISGHTTLHDAPTVWIDRAGLQALAAVLYERHNGMSPSALSDHSNLHVRSKK